MLDSSTYNIVQYKIRYFKISEEEIKFGIDVIPGPMNCHERTLFKPSHEQQNAN